MYLNGFWRLKKCLLAILQAAKPCSSLSVRIFDGLKMYPFVSKINSGKRQFSRVHILDIILNLGIIISSLFVLFAIW